MKKGPSRHATDNHKAVAARDQVSLEADLEALTDRKGSRLTVRKRNLGQKVSFKHAYGP